MSEINEKDLERVSGGLDHEAWYKRNCIHCGRYHDCSNTRKIYIVSQAEREEQAGREWNCPDKI